MPPLPEEPLALQACWRALWRGASRPSLGALGIAGGIVIASFLAYAFLLTPSTLAGEGHRYFMDHDLDTQTHVTHRVLSMQRTDAPVLVILGTSVARVCLESDTSLGARVSAAAGIETEVYNLSSDAQSPWEMVALLDQVPPDQRGVLVIGLTPPLLSCGTAGDEFNSLQSNLRRPKLGFVSTALDREAEELDLDPPVRTGIYSIDNSYFLLAHRRSVARNLVRGGVTYGDPLSAWWMETVNDPEFWSEEIEGFSTVQERFGERHRVCLEMIERAVARLRATGTYSVVLMDGPVNPGWADYPERAEFFEGYHALLREFATENGYGYMHMTEAAGLSGSDFIDYEGHIGSAAARESCSRALAGRIGKLLKP